MEKGKGSGGSRSGSLSFGFRRPASGSSVNREQASLPSVAANVTKETIVPIVLPSLPKQNSSGISKGAQRKDLKGPNKFGFRPVVVSNKVEESNKIDSGKTTPVNHIKNDSQITARKDSRLRKEPPQRGSQVAGKYTLHTSHLPRPQTPLRLTSPAHVDKWAKTVANTQTASMVHTSGSVNKFRFRSHSSNSDPQKIEIQNLEESPSANKIRSSRPVQKRPNEIIFGNRRHKTFNINDLERETTRTDEVPQSQPALTASSAESISEEKHHRDMASCEKGRRSDENLIHHIEGQEHRNFEECPGEEVWGHGEAMALPEDINSFDNLDDVNEMIPPLRAVLLEIEDPMFTSLAAISSTGISSSGMLEDEKLPELAPASPDLSSGSPASVEPLPPPPPLNKEAANESGVSPVHDTLNSSSYSSDAGREFLIDDEIADQPALVFDASQPHVSTQIATLAGQVSQVLETLSEGKSSKKREKLNSTSIGTLSPCESLASDDLMEDFEDHQTKNLSNVNYIDDSQLRSEVEMQSSQIMKEWNSILSAHPGLSNGMELGAKGGKHPSSGSTDFPKSQCSTSPHHKTFRPSSDSASNDLSYGSGITVDRGIYQAMFQDVVNIKGMLVRLKKVLQQSNSADPFLNLSNKSGLHCGLASSEAGEGNPQEFADLRRQVLLLEHQLVEKDRRICNLELQLKAKEAHQGRLTTLPSKRNSATQTNRVRPLSTGPILLQTSSSDSNSCISSTEMLNHPRISYEQKVLKRGHQVSAQDPVINSIN